MSYATGFMGMDSTLKNDADKGDEINLDELHRYIQGGKSGPSYL